MRDVYSRGQLIDLRSLAARLDDTARCYVRAAGLRKVRSRPRGCRAGKQKQLAGVHSRSADLPLTDPLCSALPSSTAPPRASLSMSAPRGRHVGLPPRQLRFATFNTCSLRNKVTAINEMLVDRGIDILCLTETWHEGPDDVPIKRLRTAGYQVLERARPLSSSLATDTIDFTNHGGVAIVAPTSVRIAKLSPKFEPSTFELLCARVTSRGASSIVAAIYRPGSVRISETFHSDLAKLLEYLSSFASPFIVTGDLNVHFEQLDDPATVRVNDLLMSYGARQHVRQSTHRQRNTQVVGGILDALITGDDCQPSDISVTDPGLSDHYLVQWLFNLRSAEPVYEERECRVWRGFDLTSFRDDLSSSFLCDTTSYTTQLDVNTLTDMYNVTIAQLLDVHAPKTKVTCRVRRRSDPWYDSDCRAAKRRARKLERRHRRWQSDYSRSAWMKSLQSSHRLVDQKRNAYWCNKIKTQSDPRQLWRAIDAVLCREQQPPNSSLSATDFADFFESKVRDIRAATDGAPSPSFVDADVQQPFQVFHTLTSSDVVKLVHAAPLKQCDLDPLPTWLLKASIDLFAPYVTHLFNVSLETGCVPDAFKVAYITPLLKKSGLDTAATENYRPVSNLSVLSKTLERAVSHQLESYLQSVDLLPPHQSAYRKGHSTETALAKVCADLITSMDAGNHALLALLDLSSAFDTVDHTILLERLSRSFAIRDVALEWLRSYLSGRYYTVRHGGSESSKRSTPFGVPQGSVLGPLLFILYTADLGVVADRRGVCSHFYADDSQLYISARPSDTVDATQRLTACLDDIALWMASNRLKLNPTKTDFMRCATHRRHHQLSRSPLSFAGATVAPSLTVRNLGVVLDSEMSFAPHISQLVSRCFFQLRRIKTCVKALPVEAAKTAVNSFVVTRIDYCNCLLAGAPRHQLDRLQAVLNTAGRLLSGLGKFDHIRHVLRDRLHWLPVPQRIQFKLCLLTYKAVHGLAPQYLTEFCRPVSSMSARSGLRSATRGDLMLNTTITNFGRRAFTVAAPAAWNRLPQHIRDSPSVDTFKSALKTFLFHD